MKPQIFSRRNARVSLIGFLLLVTIIIGCGIFFYINRVVKLDPIRLTQADLHRMELRKRMEAYMLVRKLEAVLLDVVLLTQNDLPKMRVESVHRISRPSIGGTTKESFAIVEFNQSLSGDLNVRYLLFDSASTAQKAGYSGAHHRVAEVIDFHRELNPEKVIGDAAWHSIHRRRRGNFTTHIVFVKNNILVHVISYGDPSNQLQVAQDVARKIESKIKVVLEEK